MIVLVADAARGRVDEDTRGIIEALKANGQRAVLALNKVDGMKRERLLPIAAEFSELFDFDAVFMISALTGSGCDDLKRLLAERMPKGPWHYPEDELSDLPMRLMAAEVTREQVFLKLHDELPYEATVETDIWTERDDGSVRIDHTIFVERDNQRMIVLGKGGRKIREIGQLARQQLEAMLERRVHLFLFVKVREDWQEDRERFTTWGLEWDV